MFGGRQNLALGGRHVLLTSGHDEDGLLAAHRRLDVRVRLGAKCFNLAAYTNKLTFLFN